MTTAAAPGITASASPRRFSHPLYLPLRKLTRISCVKTNCRGSGGRTYHGDWAIDFDGTRNQGIYAAGYGVAHVGRRGMGCRVGRVGEGDDRGRGNWVWVNHGAGEESRYYHLNRVLVRNGQHVTPATRLGTMGSSGFSRKCPRVNYLHFERRVKTTESRRAPLLPMLACHGRRAVSYPRAIRSLTWNVPKLQRWVGSRGVGCLRPPAPIAPPGPPAITRVPGNRAAVIRWAPSPRGASGYRVSVSIWHPSTHAWEEERIVPTAGPAAILTGLQYRRTYRIKVAAWGSAANSRWSRMRRVVMADAPQAPPISWIRPTRHSLGVKWLIPDNGGNRITRYRVTVVAARIGRVVRSVVTRPTVRRATIARLAARTRYQVRVSAVNHSGRGPATVRFASTRR